MEQEICNVIEMEIRPLIERDGGRIDFDSFENGIVYVRLSGACQNCSAVALTLKFGIERLLRRKFAEVDSVQIRD